VAEELPFADYTAAPQPPAQQQLPAAPTIRFPTKAVTEPLALPMASQATADRASLEDPTRAASRIAVTATAPPQRTDPVSFLKQNLPDPFENRRGGGLRNPPGEQETPFVGVPRPPQGN
jgi:hypothetical protein